MLVTSVIWLTVEGSSGGLTWSPTRSMLDTSVRASGGRAYAAGAGARSAAMITIGAGAAVGYTPCTAT